MGPAYRIIFEPTLTVIAAKIPVALIDKKCKAIYKCKGEEPTILLVKNGNVH